jgi:hypothetical protein
VMVIMSSFGRDVRGLAKPECRFRLEILCLGSITTSEICSTLRNDGAGARAAHG